MNNPYAPPQSNVLPNAVQDSESESIRKANLKHEASVQGMGTLYLLGGGLGALAMIASIAAAVSSAGRMGVPELLIVTVLAAIYIFMFWVGLGLRKLKPYVRIPAIILAAIGLLGFPIGTLISSYFLYLVASQKGKMVLSEHYNEIVRSTPHIRYKTPLWLWVLILLIILVVIALVALGTRG